MTYERQDIKEDFYSGNAKTIQVSVKNVEGTAKDITDAEITYLIFTDKYQEIVRKSSTVTGHMTIIDPATGVVYINLVPSDTFNVYGSFRHHVNIVDGAGLEETVLSGQINIFRTLAKRLRLSNQAAYLEGDI